MGDPVRNSMRDSPTEAGQNGRRFEVGNRDFRIEFERLKV